jgi:hypothetical protein
MTFCEVEWDGSLPIIHIFIHLTELFLFGKARSGCCAGTACCGCIAVLAGSDTFFDRANPCIVSGLAFSVLASDYRYFSDIFIELEL